MQFDIITIFPNIFDSYFKESIIKKAQQKKLVKIKVHDLRKYTSDRHKTVDDRPYGGGFGMVLMIKPIYQAVKKIKNKSFGRRTKVILLSAKGKKFTQSIAQRLSKLEQIVLICGRYEGVDERVAKNVADEEISIGEYILTGGELPAMVLVDAISRLIPGTITEGSLEEESFSKNDKYREYPHYTRPETIIINGKKRSVPKTLLSGNHQEIKEWRKKHFKGTALPNDTLKSS